MTPTAEISVTPSGFKIVYYDKSHRYKLGKITTIGPGNADMTETKPEFVPSVSTILDGSVPKNLTGWAERLTAEGIVTLASERAIGRLGPEAILAELHAKGLRYYQARDKAAMRGTSVHRAFEDLADGVIPTLADYPLNERGYLRGICKWWAIYQPEVLHAELMVASWKHQFAGRMDLLAKLGNDLTVIDLKTSKAIRDTHHFQTAGYMIGAEESGYGAPHAGYVLRVSADGEFEFVKTWATAGQFIALHLSRAAQKEFERHGKLLAKGAA